MQVDPRKVNLAEADIEQYLWENSNVIQVYGHPISQWIKRQFHIPSGVLDLMGVNAAGTLVVVEVKNTELKIEHIAQVKRYVYDIDSILLSGKLYLGQCVPVLIGRSVTESVYRDCEACGVLALMFNVSLSLQVRPIYWSEKFSDDRKRCHFELTEDEDLAGYISNAIELRRQAIKEDEEENPYMIIEKDEYALLKATTPHTNGANTQ